MPQIETKRASCLNLGDIGGFTSSTKQPLPPIPKVFLNFFNSSERIVKDSKKLGGRRCICCSATKCYRTGQNDRENTSQRERRLSRGLSKVGIE